MVFRFCLFVERADYSLDVNVIKITQACHMELELLGSWILIPSASNFSKFTPFSFVYSD